MSQQKRGWSSNHRAGVQYRMVVMNGRRFVAADAPSKGDRCRGCVFESDTIGCQSMRSRVECDTKEPIIWEKM